MSIENPISTIRKAVKVSAEEQALSEKLDKPESKHYEEVFKLFKVMRKLNPEMLEKNIILIAKGKDLKDEAGVELYKTFRKVWKELSNLNPVNEEVKIWNKFRETQSLPELSSKRAKARL